jgi:hypothetical protein
MPRFFLKLRPPSGLETDPQGFDFANLDQAQSTFEIADASGHVVAKVPFAG